MTKAEIKNHISTILNKNMKKSEQGNLPNANNASFNVYNEAWATVISVDIVNFKLQVEKYYRWALIKMVQAFSSSIIKIGKENENFVSAYVNGDEVILAFSANRKEKIDSIYETAILINSTINYLLSDMLNVKKYDVIKFQAGVGIWTSEKNSLVKYGEKGSSNESYHTLIGESINYATALSKIANREGFSNIMMNSVTYINLSKEIDSIKNNWIKQVYLNNSWNQTGLEKDLKNILDIESVYQCSVRFNSFVEDNE